MKNIKRKKNRAFTLVEMLVAMTLFSFVITMALGALFMIMKANEKAKIVRVVVNNLNVALEGMSRELRMGSEYDVSSDGKSIIFKTKEGCWGGYKWEGESLKRAIARRTDPNNPTSSCDPSSKSGLEYKKLTGDNIKITSMGFVKAGGSSGIQPKVFIYLKGEIQKTFLGENQPLYIQTLISQRKLEN